jgi:hypothetical protein
MRDLTKQERSAVEAAAKLFSARWEKAANAHEANLTIGGKRVTLEIATLKTRPTNRAKAAKPRLRFDKAVNRLMRRLQSFASESVPDGATVLVTLPAPIRQWSKTAADLQPKIQSLLSGRLASRDHKTSIHGNRIQIRVLRHKVKEGTKLIGFVHNPDTDALLLLNMTRELLEVMNAEPRNATGKSSDQRWLVLDSPAPSSFLETYSYIASQLRIPTHFAKVSIVFADGHADSLEG